MQPDMAPALQLRWGHPAPPAPGQAAPGAGGTARVVRPLGLAGTAGAALFLAVLAALHVLRPDLGVASAMVSDYANGPYGGWFTAALVGHGAGNLALAAGLGIRLAPSRLGRLGSILLGVAAAGVLAAAVFPTDPDGAPRTTTGAIHGAVATGSFPLEVVALLLLARALARTAEPVAARLTGGLAALAGLALGWLGVALSRQDPAGVPERLVLVSLAVWELSAASWLLRAGRRAPRACQPVAAPHAGRTAVEAVGLRR